tara:strand:+ start:4135 stop:4257 length:123 start_codon:yes stop_codon:yes gene_type:complete
MIRVILLSLILTGCTTHSITLGPMSVYGSNEQEIYLPEKQ